MGVCNFICCGGMFFLCLVFDRVVVLMLDFVGKFCDGLYENVFVDNEREVVVDFF